jgi:hypothetical protein
LTDGGSARQWRDGRALLIALRGKRGQSCVLAFNPALGLTDAAGRGGARRGGARQYRFVSDDGLQAPNLSRNPSETGVVLNCDGKVIRILNSLQ